MIDRDNQIIEIGAALPGATLRIQGQRRAESECSGPSQLRSVQAMGPFIPVDVVESPFVPSVRFGSLFALHRDLVGCAQRPD